MQTFSAYIKYICIPVFFSHDKVYPSEVCLCGLCRSLQRRKYVTESKRKKIIQKSGEVGKRSEKSHSVRSQRAVQ